ncbi:MAG: NRAMP family divalent metal transporter [Terriglobales bacterium]
MALGPGLVAGGANNDPAGLATFAIVGAVTGFSQLWMLLLTTPLLVAVQTTCGVLGGETKRGLATLLRIRFGWPVSLLVAIAFVLGNFAALVADTQILSDALYMVTGMPRWYFPVLIVFLTWYLLVFHNFRRLIGTLVLFNVSFLVYVVASVGLHPNWGQVLRDSLWLHWSAPGVARRDFLANAAALLGSRLSPYMFFWQASAETEKYTDVRLRDQTKLDISIGMIISNVIGYFVIVTTGASLFPRHVVIHGIEQAAVALRPVAGGAADLLFSLGIIGSGLIAIPVLAATSSYVVAETMEWRHGLEQRPWQARRFYVVLSLVLLAVALLSYAGLNTITVAFDSQVFWGVLAPVLLFLVLFIDRRHKERRVPITAGMRAWLVVAVVLTTGVAGWLLLQRR